jgi:hypothetical protein
MQTGARTPEELDALLEDTFVLRDEAALCSLFDHDAVLAATSADVEARGVRAIGCTAGALWSRECLYVGGNRRVLETRGTALVIAASATHVARRRHDGTWRLVISLLHLDQPLTEDCA